MDEDNKPKSAEEETQPEVIDRRRLNAEGEVKEPEAEPAHAPEATPAPEGDTPQTPGEETPPAPQGGGGPPAQQVVEARCGFCRQPIPGVFNERVVTFQNGLNFLLIICPNPYCHAILNMTVLNVRPKPIGPPKKPDAPGMGIPFDPKALMRRRAQS